MDRKKAEQIFHALFDRNRGRWIGIARCYALPAERDDLLQEMLLQIWRSLPRFKQQSQIDTWAYRVALNTALSWDGKRKRRNEKLPRDKMDDLATLAESRSSTADTERRMPQDAAAKVLGISSSAFRVRVHRLKKKFQETHQLDWSAVE